MSVTLLIASSCSGDNKSATPTTTVTPTSIGPAPAPATTAAPAAEPKFSFGFVAPSLPLLLDLAYAQENAISLAVADINDGGGVLGAPVKATSTDDQVAGSVANAVTSLVAGGANAVLGPISSTDAKAAIPAVAGAGALACSASATSPDLNSNPPAAAFYRTALPDYNTVEFVATQIVERRDAVAPGQPWKVAIVARGDDYGTSVSSGLSSLLSSQGITTSVISYDPQRTSLGQQAADAVALAPNLVVAVTYEEAPRLIDQLVNQGIPAASIIGLDAMFQPRLAEMTFPGAPEKLDGMTVIGVSGDRAFLRRLNALPSGQVLYGAQMYDCVIVIALAAEAARSTDPAVYGPKINAVLSGDRACSTYDDCRAKLVAGESIAYQGQLGSFTFGPSNTPTASRFTIANLANGNFVVTKTVNLDITALQAAQATEVAMAAAVQTTRLQQALTGLGLYSGPIDGQASEALTASIAALQQQLGLPATGVYDAETDAALRQKLGTASSAVNDATISLQLALEGPRVLQGADRRPVLGRDDRCHQSLPDLVGRSRHGRRRRRDREGHLRTGGGVRTASPGNDDGATDRANHRAAHDPEAHHAAHHASTDDADGDPAAARAIDGPGHDQTDCRAHDRARHDETADRLQSAQRPARRPPLQHLRGTAPHRRPDRFARPPRTRDRLRADERCLRRAPRGCARRSTRRSRQAPRAVGGRDGGGTRDDRRSHAGEDPHQPVGPDPDGGWPGRRHHGERCAREPTCARGVERHRPAHHRRPAAELMMARTPMVTSRVTTRSLILLVMVAVVLGACGKDDNDAAPAQPDVTISPSTPLEGTTWELGPQGLDLPGLEQSRPTLLLRDGTASGFSGCNRYTGPYTLASPGLTFGNLAGTQAACPPIQTAIERAYLDRLSRVAKFDLGLSDLQLQDASGATLLSFTAANTSLVGSWTVTGYLNSSGSAFMSTEAAGTPTAVFVADGTVSGTTGCNSYNGPWTQGPDDAVHIGPLAKTLAACTDAALSAQETSFVQALEASVNAEVASHEATFLNSAGQRTLMLTR